MTNKIDQSLLNPFQVTKNRSYKNHQKLNFLICRLSSKQTQLPKNSQKIAFNAPNRTKNIMPTKHKKQKKRYLIEEYIYPSKRIPRSMESRKKDRSSRTSATARSPLDKWSSPDAAGCENRKSDWPVRKRAEQKHHAEFSVGRSSIIGAEYRSIGLPPDTPARVRSFPRVLSLSLSLPFSPLSPPFVLLLARLAPPLTQSLSLPCRNFAQGYLVNLAHRHRHLYGGQPARSIVVDTRNTAITRDYSPHRKCEWRMTVVRGEEGWKVCVSGVGCERIEDFRGFWGIWARVLGD